RRTWAIPCFHVFTIATHVLGLIDRSGKREIKIWQCGKPPISPRFPPNHERQLPQRVCNRWPNCPRPISQPTGHVSPPFTATTMRPTAPREGAEKLPND